MSFVEQARYENNRKSAGIAYLFWFLVGLFGAHRFYLHQFVTGTAMLALWVSGWIMILGAGSPIGIICLILDGLWLVVDLFLIPGMARAYNEALLQELAASES